MSFPAYDEYKDSGVEWLGDVPEHWEILHLKYAADVFPSNVDKKSKDGESAVKLCNYTDVYYNEEITPAIKFMDATATEDQIEKFELQAGDTIITKDSESADDIAVPAYVPEDLPGVICGYHLSMIRPFEGYAGAFVSRLFQSDYARARFETLANGLTRVGLAQYALDNIEFPFPPLSEQTAIAEFLDRETAKIDDLIAEQKKLIALLKEKRQAVISHAVTKGLNPDAPLKDSGIEWLGDVPAHWAIKKLAWILQESPKNGASPQINADGRIPTFSIAAVRNGTTDIHGHIKHADISIEDASPYFVEKGDILVLRGNGNKSLVGTAGIVTDEPPENCIYPDILIRIRPTHSATPWYLVTLLNSSTMRPTVEMAAQTASGVWKISGKSLQDYRLPIPPVDEQEDIQLFCEKHTDRLDTLTSEAERSIELLQERRTALISAAVTGKIDVREYAPAEAV